MARVQMEQSLLAELWLKELDHLRDICARGNQNTADRAIRRAFHLKALSPRPLQRILPLDISEQDFEALLDQGETESAARALVGRDWTITISPSPITGRVVARLAGRRSRVLEAAGDCPALAIVGAWTQLMAGMPADAGASRNTNQLRATASGLS